MAHSSAAACGFIRYLRLFASRLFVASHWLGVGLFGERVTRVTPVLKGLTVDCISRCIALQVSPWDNETGNNVAMPDVAS